MGKSVCVVMINYKTPYITIEGINSALKAINDKSYIVVVDNNSNDGSFEKLVEHYKTNKKVVVIESSDNAGFSSGNNIGIRYALKNNTDFILLLNNDTEIDRRMVDELVTKADENTVTVPKMYYFADKNRIWYAGGCINKYTGRISHIGIDEMDNGQYDQDRYVDFATGCAVLIHSSIIRRIGMMDESYFMYVEDVDYSLNMKKHNIEILFVPTAKLWHKVGASSGSKSNITVYYGNRGRFMLMNKYNFSIMAKLYFYLTRLILITKGYLLNTNDRLILTAFLDFKKGVIGKTDCKN